MMEGWERRYNHLEDLFINWSAYPQYQMNMKKAPPIESFFKHRKKKPKNKQEDKREVYQEILEEFNL